MARSTCRPTAITAPARRTAASGLFHEDFPSCLTPIDILRDELHCIKKRAVTAANED